MDITYFGPSIDVFAQAFYDSVDDEFDLVITTNTPTQVVGINPDTNWEVTMTGTGLNANTLSGTVTGITIRDDLGNTIMTLTNFAWATSDLIPAMIDLIELDDSTALDALLDIGDVNFDGSGAVDGFDLVLDTLTTNVDAIGTPFDDTLEGGSGDDSLAGGAGRDRLEGNDGNDTIDASGGSTASQGWGDYIRPGLGSNTIIGHAGLYASGDGIDISYGNMSGVGGGLTINVGANGSGTAVAANGAVNDTFTYANYFEGSAGNDSITGSNADHWEGFAPLGGADTVNGRGGYDMLSYQWEISYFGGVGSGIVVDAAAGTVTDTQGNTDHFSNIEEIRGSERGDTMSAVGSATGMHFEGLDGNDSLLGSAHSDWLEGGDGNDTIRTGDNDLEDIVVPGRGNDLVDFSGVVTGFGTLGHWDLSAGINATIDGNANTGTIDKGMNGTTTIVGIQTTMTGTNNFGFALIGSSHNDSFNLTVADGGWMMVNGSAGTDSYQINASNGS
ncbi:calcium-binding protein, partial [Marimonas arenosa]|nr:hypothetical protein [Marimonas arenosa]